jgi:sulfur-oxidizing protein SoxY
MSSPFSRREALTIGVGALSAASVAGPVAPAQDQPGDAAALLADFTGGATPTDEHVALELLEAVDTGNAVALTVRVEGPMTEASYVSELLVLAEGNRSAKVGRYAFFLPNGIAEVTTRIRLEQTSNKTQIVTAIAKVQEGDNVRFFKGSKEVKVTVGACES